jgi:hypothetical protein
VQVDYVNSPDANTLRAILRALPAEVEVINVYARGGEHFAWFRLPARSVMVAAPSEPVPPPLKIENQKRKGK